MDQKIKYLSYSGYSTYVSCPKKYDYHYNEKLRPETEPSHLLFGSAVDKALNEILLGKTKQDAMELAKQELLRLFDKGVTIEEKDYDDEIITESYRPLLEQKLRDSGWEGTNTSHLAASLFQKVSMGDELSENQTKSLKTLVYVSYLEKISLMVDAFIDYVVPRIEEVVSVQSFVKRGIQDFQAKIKGIEGIVTCDNKTSARDYPPDAVIKSVQLAGYGATTGAYIVFNKTVRKNRTKICTTCNTSGTGKRHKTCDVVTNGVRCNGDWIETITPEIIPQIIIGEIPEHNRTLVEQAYQDTEKLIETKVFPRNLTACGQQYGRPCPYINLCWNQNMKGLKVNEPKS